MYEGRQGRIVTESAQYHFPGVPPRARDVGLKGEFGNKPPCSWEVEVGVCFIAILYEAPPRPRNLLYGPAAITTDQNR